MLTGNIKWFNTDAGFGYITCEYGAPDVYLDIRYWIPECTYPIQGQRVEFETMVDRKGKVRAKYAWPEHSKR